jgi:hypothetical protein
MWLWQLCGPEQRRSARRRSKVRSGHPHWTPTGLPPDSSTITALAIPLARDAGRRPNESQSVPANWMQSDLSGQQLCCCCPCFWLQFPAVHLSDSARKPSSQWKWRPVGRCRRNHDARRRSRAVVAGKKAHGGFDSFARFQTAQCEMLGRSGWPTAHAFRAARVLVAAVAKNKRLPSSSRSDANKLHSV